MRLTGSTRWVLIGLGVVCILLAPFGLIAAGNTGGAILNSILNRKPTRNELVGHYEYRPTWGRVFLELKRDGTFREQIEENGKSPRLISGAWSATNGENYLDVGFQPFGEVNDDDHESLGQNSGMPFFKPHLGKTYGIVDDDLDEKFEQQ